MNDDVPQRGTRDSAQAAASAANAGAPQRGVADPAQAAANVALPMSKVEQQLEARIAKNESDIKNLKEEMREL